MEDGVMVQEHHKPQPLATAVSKYTMLCHLQEELDLYNQKGKVEETPYSNLQIYKKKIHNSILFSRSIFDLMHSVYLRNYNNIQLTFIILQIMNPNFRKVFMFPSLIIFYLQYSCFLNGNQFVRVEYNISTISRSGCQLIMQYYSLKTKKSHEYSKRNEEEENNWTTRQVINLSILQIY